MPLNNNTGIRATKWKMMPISMRITNLLKLGYNLQEAASYAKLDDAPKQLVAMVEYQNTKDSWEAFSQNIDEKDNKLDVDNLPHPDDDLIMSMFSNSIENAKKNHVEKSDYANQTFISSDEYNSTLNNNQYEETRNNFYSDFKKLLNKYNAKVYLVDAYDVNCQKIVCKRLEIRIGDNQFFLDNIPHNCDDVDIHNVAKSINIKEDTYEFDKDVQNGDGVHLYY